LSFPNKAALSSQPCLLERRTRWAQTLQKGVSARGKGLFTGVEAEIQFLPAPEGSGVLFQRIDVKGLPQFRADLSLVQGTPRCTIIGNEEFSVQTIEHLMAALSACQVDNVLIRLSGPEVPIFDGSSLKFVEMLDEAGLLQQREEKITMALQKPVYCSGKDALLIALPSEELRISYTLHYPHSSCVGTQFYSTILDKELFKREIAPCRTFSVYEEVAPLIEKGLLKGGSLENAVVIKDDRVMNPGGLRFSNEMVRHKILDMIGDLYLMGVSFSAHIIAVRSGHSMNNIFANELLNHFKGEGL
jgi:UDP-3-O-[3-hydroxymyristoyl] N-acetylglucosamine deacetylase